MSRLLKIVQPDYLYMGQKDYQQCMVVKKLLHILEISTELVTVPTVREQNGLAMSSRNLRLSDEDREKAGLIYQALKDIRRQVSKGNLEPFKNAAVNRLKENGFVVDYVEIADANDLQPVSEWNGSQPLVALAAATLGGVRLIDNMLLQA